MPRKPLTRRQFLDVSATAVAAATIVPRNVLGGADHVAPSDKVTIAYVGCGTQGLRQMMEALKKPAVQIVAVCDPNRKSDDYVEWSRHELNEKIRKFLAEPDWAQTARGGLCGREVGQHVVDGYYAQQKTTGERPNCRTYADFREMLDKEKHIDAVYNMTPDHLHGTVALWAMRHGKHVITHKPIANVLHEARLARDTARKTGRATQLFCAADKSTTPALCEWLASGVIGPVREVHNWSSRPFWPQGMLDLPAGAPPVPDGLDWNLWLGPVPQRAYHPAYTHAVFRGWYEFGTGALGDMGHYSFYQIFKMLNLGIPTSVEASRSQFYSIKDYTWQKERKHVAFPEASTIRWEFPARGDQPPVTLNWYDGGLRPPMPEELKRDGEQLADEGLLLVGDRGKILAGFMGDNARLIPKARMADFRTPPATLPRPIEELDQFLRACQGGPASDANFERAYPFAETILLGTIALRADKRLLWDSENLTFTNSREANRWLTREYRQGWEL